MTSPIIPSHHKNISQTRRRSASPPKIRKKASDNTISKDDLDLLSLKDKNINDLDLPFLKEKLSEDKTLIEKFIKSQNINENIFVLKHAETLSSEQINLLFNKGNVGVIMKMGDVYKKLLLATLERPELSGDKIWTLRNIQDLDILSKVAKHPNAPKILYRKDVSSECPLVQALIQQQSLIKLLEQEERLSESESDHNQGMLNLINNALYSSKNDPLLKILVKHPFLSTDKKQHDNARTQLMDIIADKEKKR